MVEQVRLAIFYTQWFAILLNEYEPLLSVFLYLKIFLFQFTYLQSTLQCTTITPCRLCSAEGWTGGLLWLATRTAWPAGRTGSRSGRWSPSSAWSASRSRSSCLPWRPQETWSR